MILINASYIIIYYVINQVKKKTLKERQQMSLRHPVTLNEKDYDFYNHSQEALMQLNLLTHSLIILPQT